MTRAYLERLLGEGQRTLWVYGRNRDAGSHASPENIAFEGKYYNFKRPDGTWDDGLETFLANHIEEPGIELVRRLARRETGLAWQERERLALALALRPGATIKEIQELAGHKTITMSARYAHLSPDHKLSVIDRIAATATGNTNSHQNSHQ